MKLFKTSFIFSILITLFSIKSVYAQVDLGKNDTLIVRAVVVEGDTIPFAYLPIVNIYSERIFKSKRAQINNSRKHI